jgi:opacity protein-like surface antigen
MRTITLLLVTALLLTATTAARAAEQYWTAEGGFFFPASGDMDDGFNFEGAYGTRLIDIAPALGRQAPIWSKLWLEAGGGYYHSETSGLPVDNDIDVISLTLSALLRHALNTQVDLYGGAGLGLYLIDSDWNDGRGERHSDLGALAIGGAAFALTPNIDLTAELKWRIVGHDADGAVLTGGVRYAF